MHLPVDPLKFAKILWPHITFYREQREIIYSVHEEAYETFVPAGNMLGKDFVSAFIALWFFLTRHPCRVVTTSVDHTQLEGVLWGEIRRLIQESSYPLDHVNGGPLVINHLHLRKIITTTGHNTSGTPSQNSRSVSGQDDRGTPGENRRIPTTSNTKHRSVKNTLSMCGLSYLLGRVAAKGEGLLGHHIADIGDGIARTLLIIDEASGVDNISYERGQTWANRILIIGNPYPCRNFFYHGVRGGSIKSESA